MYVTGASGYVGNDLLKPLVVQHVRFRGKQSDHTVIARSVRTVLA